MKYLYTKIKNQHVENTLLFNDVENARTTMKNDFIRNLDAETKHNLETDGFNLNSPHLIAIKSDNYSFDNNEAHIKTSLKSWHGYIFEVET